MVFHRGDMVAKVSVKKGKLWRIVVFRNLAQPTKS